MEELTKEEESKYEIFYTGLFKKDFKRYQNDEDKVEKITQTIKLLKIGGINNLPSTMKAHKLTGNYKGHLECHILPDLLIIWLQYDEEKNEIYLVRLGSHAELFKN